MDDWGAGWFTAVVGYFLKHHGGALTSVDNNGDNVRFARQWTRRLPVAVHEADSVEFLRGYSGPPLDVLYLDSMDTEDPRHADHCLAEAQAGFGHVKPGGLVVIDDSPDRKGKGRSAVTWLIGQGCSVRFEGYQVVLSKS